MDILFGNGLFSFGLTVCNNGLAVGIGKLNVGKLQQCYSYREHLLLKHEGTDMELPESLHDTVALVLLENKSREKLIEDANLILHLETSGDLF
jgi:hypothetical protein